MTLIIRPKKVIQKTTIGFKCDHCGNTHEGEKLPQNWHEFTSGHQGWGRDSIDAFETHHVCSVRCYTELAKKLFKKLQSKSSAEIDSFSIDFMSGVINTLNKGTRDMIHQAPSTDDVLSINVADANDSLLHVKKEGKKMYWGLSSKVFAYIQWEEIPSKLHRAIIEHYEKHYHE